MTDFMAEMHQIRFRGPQTPLRELTALPRPHSWIWGPLRGRGGAGKRRERGGEGEGGEVEGREREGTQVTVEPEPLRALLRHWSKGQRSTCFTTDLRHCVLQY